MGKQLKRTKELKMHPCMVVAMDTWWSFRLMRMPGATTFWSRSMSANTHSSLEEMRKSPLKSALKPYRKDSRLQGRR